jgi:3-hydroxyacyl-CoA dehydrogenase/enoyl-CoA hydratase/3-hydroxybutyryl-CoA epimerase
MHKCLDSGVLQEPKDADVGSILGLGFPHWRSDVVHII